MLRNNTLRDSSAPEQISASAELRREHIIDAAVKIMTDAYDDPEITQQDGLVPNVSSMTEFVRPDVHSADVTPSSAPLSGEVVIDTNSAASQASITEMAA